MGQVSFTLASLTTRSAEWVRTEHLMCREHTVTGAGGKDSNALANRPGIAASTHRAVCSIMTVFSPSKVQVGVKVT